MKIYVCVKQIPDPNTVVSRLDPNTKRLVRSGGFSRVEPATPFKVPFSDGTWKGLRGVVRATP